MGGIRHCRRVAVRAIVEMPHVYVEKFYIRQGIEALWCNRKTMASVKLFTQSWSWVCAEKFGTKHASFIPNRRFLVFLLASSSSVREMPQRGRRCVGSLGASTSKAGNARSDLIQDEVVDLLRGVNMSNTDHSRRFSCSNVVAALGVSTDAIQG